MGDAENSEKQFERLEFEYKNVLATYLPFIEEMKEKSTGTSIEIKWKLMHDSLVKPQKALTFEMLQKIRFMLDGLKTQDELKKQDANLQAQESEEQNLPAQDSGIDSQPKIPAVVTTTTALNKSSNEHSYAKCTTNEAEKESSDKPEAPPSTSNAILTSNSKSSADEEKSSNVKKLTIHDLFRNTEPSEDITFDVSDSEYPELEKDDGDLDSEIADDASKEELTDVQEESDSEDEDTKKEPEDKAKEPTEKDQPESTDMELDEELMEMNRTIVNEEKPLESTDNDSKTITPKSQSNASATVQQEKVATVKSSPMRKDHIAITDDLIKEVILLKEQMIIEQGKKRAASISDSESSRDYDSEESLMEEVEKTNAMKIKLPSAKKRRIKQEKDEDGFKGFAPSEVEDLNNITIIPYQISSPAPFVPKTSTYTQNNIANISFLKLKRGFMFKCHANGCRFQTLVKETLKEHVETKHNDQVWDGFCNLCVQKIGRQEFLIKDELRHMEMHLQLFEEAAKEAQRDSTNEPKQSSVFLSPSSLPDNSCVKPSKKERTKSWLPASLTQKPAKKVVEAKQIAQASESSSLLSKFLVDSTFQPPVVNQAPKPSNMLRPWLPARLLKNQEQAQDMLESKEALAAIYKCMSSSCNFFTIDRVLFLKHLSFHEKFTASDKVNFLTCSYCDFVARETTKLADHIDDEHIHDQFQCNYCFYRACTVLSVTTHQSLFHKTQPCVIIECDLIKPRDTRAHLEKVAKLRADFVPPMICVFCRGIFFVTQALKEHLRKHDAEKLAKCNGCEGHTTSLQLFSHFETCHGIGSFQCVYCDFGTENFNKLNHHIVNNHASKIPLYCERVWNTNPDGTHKFESPSVVEATCIKNIKPNFQNHCKKELRKAPKDQALLRNEGNVGMLKPNLVIHKTNERKGSEPPVLRASMEKSTITIKKPVETTLSRLLGPANVPNIQASSQTVKVQAVRAGNHVVTQPVKIQAVSRVKIVAQMPREVLTPSQEISSLLKPLPFK